MAKEKIYLFVEGNDDEIYFRRLIAPLLNKYYKNIEIIKYAQMKKDKVNLFLLSINTLNFDYLFFADKDEYLSINQKKEKLYEKFEQLEKEKIIIVVLEIESWYLAGLDERASEILHINYLDSTDNISKEDFNRLYHGRFHSRIDFIYEIIKLYTFEKARQKNKSFSYFYNEYIYNHK